MKHEKRSTILNNGFRRIDQQRDASDLLAFVAISLFIGAGAIWLQILLNATGD